MKRSPEYVRLTPRPICRKPSLIMAVATFMATVRTLAVWPSKQ